jgi:hypothetical protein
MRVHGRKTINLRPRLVLSFLLQLMMLLLHRFKAEIMGKTIF